MAKNQQGLNTSRRWKQGNSCKRWGREEKKARSKGWTGGPRPSGSSDPWRAHSMAEWMRAAVAKLTGSPPAPAASDDEREYEEIFCAACNSGDDDEKLILCDGCPKAYHTYCLKPKLKRIPAGDWFCPSCALPADGAAKAAAPASAPASDAGGGKRKGRPSKRRGGAPRTGPDSGHAVCHRAFSKLKLGEYAPQEALLTRYFNYPHQSKGTIDITEEMAAGPANYDTVLAALEYITFPQNTNRKNVKKNNDRSEYMESMCLGAVFSWAKRSSYGWGGGAGGGNGMIVSSHTQARPNLSRLLCRYCGAEKQGFSFTSIQVNKNYQSIMHCDKRNLGPSQIVGLGDYTDGKLWGQEFGAVDLKGGKWVSFDGNLPHCTLPFKGTRYTLIYFINQSCERAASETTSGTTARTRPICCCCDSLPACIYAARRTRAHYR